jgi:ATP-dependent protease Clp ATPase subunit
MCLEHDVCRIWNDDAEAVNACRATRKDEGEGIEEALVKVMEGCWHAGGF